MRRFSSRSRTGPFAVGFVLLACACVLTSLAGCGWGRVPDGGAPRGSAAAAASSEPAPTVSVAKLPIAIRSAKGVPVRVDVKRANGGSAVEASVTVEVAKMSYLGEPEAWHAVATRKVSVGTEAATVRLTVHTPLRGRVLVRASASIPSASSAGTSELRDTNLVGAKVIALTFDDGPSASTTRMVLNALRRDNVHATFFVSGRLADRHPKLVQREFAEGNEVASHGATHANLSLKDDAGMAEELRVGRETLRKLTGRAPTSMRPPYGAVDDHIRAAIRAAGMEPTLWDIDTLDWRDRNAALIPDAVMREARDGAIVLMHDSGGQSTSTGVAVPEVISKLREAGYGFVTITELRALGRSGSDQLTGTGGDFGAGFGGP